MCDKRKEVRDEAKAILENQIRGKFIGCFFIIRIGTKQGYLFDNRTFYKSINRIKSDWIFTSIELDDSNLDSCLSEKVKTSSSIVKVTSDSRRDYQSRIIDQITKDDAVVIGLKQAFYVINRMLPKERNLLIGHGILGFSFRTLSKNSDCPSADEKYLQRIYRTALENFALGLGISVDE